MSSTNEYFEFFSLNLNNLASNEFQNYIIYYTKNPDDDLKDWEQTTVGGDQLEVTVPADEDTPYNVRVQAATKDGPGIVSEAYDVTTGKKRQFFSFLYVKFEMLSERCIFA